MENLNQRVAVVTGAGSGIGRQIAISLAKKGCFVALADISLERLKETQALLSQQGSSASTHVCDVADKNSVADMAADIYAQYGQINIVVNNAGVMVIDGFETHSMEDFEWLFGINFWGVVYGCKYFLPYLRNAEEAHIVNISSMYGFAGLPAQTSYCASKFAVRGFNESLRAELRQTNVGFTSIHPGAINTNIMADAKTHDESEGGFKALSSKYMAKLASSPQKVAQKTLWAIENNKPRVRVGADAYFFDYCARISPVAFNSLLSMMRKKLGYIEQPLPSIQSLQAEIKRRQA